MGKNAFRCVSFKFHSSFHSPLYHTIPYSYSSQAITDTKVFSSVFPQHFDAYGCQLVLFQLTETKTKEDFSKAYFISVIKTKTMITIEGPRTRVA